MIGAKSLFGEGGLSVSKRGSPMPEWFASDSDRWYWHEAQDIAWRAGAIMVERSGAVWLLAGDTERLVCEPADSNCFWFESWRALKDEYPEHARSWVNGRPISKPGE